MKIVRTLACILFLGAAAVPASAQKSLSALPEVKAAEAYLAGLSTFEARFTQTDNGGQKAAGVFRLQRPGKMRFQYDPPMTDFIVADGIFVHYYDGDLKQASNTLISRSLADFFLRKKLQIPGEDLAVSDVRRAGGLLWLTLTQARDPLAGSLTLVFAEKPMELRRWVVVDGQGARTTVELSQIRTKLKFNPELFRFYDPAHGKKGLN